MTRLSLMPKTKSSPDSRPNSYPSTLGALDSVFAPVLETVRQVAGWVVPTTRGPLPRFISFLKHGESDFAAPLLATNDSIYGFVLQSDRNSVQQFVDATLGATASGIKYQVLGNHVVLLFQHCGHFTSPENIGWAEDYETAILIPLIEKPPGIVSPEKLVFWIPYLLIDVALGMVTGRDVWGYNKTQGWTSMPARPQDRAEFKCETIIFKKFDRSRKAQKAVLVSVSKTGNLGVLQTVWQDAGAFFQALLQAIGDFRVSWRGAEVGFDLINTVLRHDVPLINLKQMRDSERTELACYQALVEAKLVITGFGGAGPLPGNYEVTFCDCDSHTIVRDFGFSAQNGRIPVKFAFWAKLDFNAPAGKVVWQAA